MATIGVEKLYFAVITKDSQTEVIFDTPVYLEGVQEIKIKPKQSTAKAYAENKLWVQFTSLDEIEVSINLFDLTKENQIKLLGHTAATEGGLFATNSDSAPYVALLYCANTSKQGIKRYGILYKGKFELPEDSVKGQEGKIDYQTPEMKATFQPLIKNGMWKYFVDTDDADCPIDIDTKFFTKVTVPTKKTTV